MGSESLRSAAGRLFDRYRLEFVEQYNFCPWSAKAWQDGEVDVYIDTSPNVDEHLDADFLAGKLTEKPITILIFPYCDLPYEAWVQTVATRITHPGFGKVAAAAFHPAGRHRDEAGVVPLLRASPDPLIQCVKRDVVANLSATGSLAGGTKAWDLVDWPARQSPSDKVMADNIKRYESVGRDELKTVLDDIMADRNKSYSEWQVPRW